MYDTLKPQYTPLTPREQDVLSGLPAKRLRSMKEALCRMAPHLRSVVIESLLNPSKWNEPSTCYSAVDGD